MCSDPSNPPNFSTFFDKYKEYLDETCKLAVPKKTVRNLINNPWITDSIILAIDKKDDLYSNWKSTCTKKDPVGDRSMHKIFSDNYRRILKHIITDEKKKYHDKKFLNASGDPKKTWQIINQLRGKQKRTMKAVFIIDNQRIIDRRVIANEFNKYFVSLACQLNDKVQIQSGDFGKFMHSSQANSMFLNECSEDEVNTIIRELQNGKSSDIPIGVIKKTSKIISPILSSHFNYLMKVGKFPDELKLGKITPIYKKESDELLENYRPVSTLPIFGKIFEKIIYSRLYNYFVSKGILHDRQFGFRKQHSTSHVVIDEKLSWDAHVKSLTKKLASCTGSINRIAASIPKTLYMNLYYTLFESYITYGITVWGSIPNRKFNKLFNAQKKILRVLFGDREKFLDKFRTCIRARPYNPEQNLPTEFYVKEHSKPLFNKNKILNLKNLYLYHCANETFKILKFRSPIVVHNLYKFSTRGQRNLLS